MSTRSKTRATLDQLKKKGRVERELSMGIKGDDGEVQEVTLLFRSIGREQYDNLQAQFPPKPKHKARNLYYDPDAFAPALVAATLAEPKMTYDDAAELWQSEEWNPGELQRLFLTAVEVCNSGFDVPSNGSG